MEKSFAYKILKPYKIRRQKNLKATAEEQFLFNFFLLHHRQLQKFLDFIFFRNKLCPTYEKQVPAWIQKLKTSTANNEEE